MNFRREWLILHYLSKTRQIFDFSAVQMKGCKWIIHCSSGVNANIAAKNATSRHISLIDGVLASSCDRSKRQHDGRTRTYVDVHSSSGPSDDHWAPVAPASVSCLSYNEVNASSVTGVMRTKPVWCESPVSLPRIRTSVAIFGTLSLLGKTSTNYVYFLTYQHKCWNS